MTSRTGPRANTFLMTRQRSIREFYSPLDDLLLLASAYRRNWRYRFCGNVASLLCFDLLMLCRRLLPVWVPADIQNMICDYLLPVDAALTLSAGIFYGTLAPSHWRKPCECNADSWHFCRFCGVFTACGHTVQCTRCHRLGHTIRYPACWDCYEQNLPMCVDNPCIFHQRFQDRWKLVQRARYTFARLCGERKKPGDVLPSHSARCLTLRTRVADLSTIEELAEEEEEEAKETPKKIKTES
jgi:hypothetical protein